MSLFTNTLLCSRLAHLIIKPKLKFEFWSFAK